MFFTPKTGKLFEIGMGKVVPVLLGASALSVGSIWLNSKLLYVPPASLADDFKAEAAAKDGIAEREGAPPVFLNPIRRGLPGTMRGPEDVATS